MPAPTVPEDIAARLNHHGQTSQRDTDWHVDRLYDGLLADATVVRATLHRYVIDVNRGAGRPSPSTPA
jgi:N-formylglutamate deformylase